MAILKLVAVVALLWVGYWWWLADERENYRHINKAIYPAFRAIENKCLAEHFPHETVRCQNALALLNWCSNTESQCSANEYYDELLKFGFDLPPFYEPGYKPR